MLELLLRDVTGKLSLAIWRSVFRARKMFVSCCYYFDVVLNAFGWYLQPDGETRVPRP